MEEILRRFPGLTEVQRSRLEQLAQLIRDWNSKINLVSRKDIEGLEIHHILHSMAIAKWTKFVPGTTILDVGTGGGFPGLPLAILFPECAFHLVDARGKKIKVVQEIAQELQLNNVFAQHVRVEEMSEHFEFVVTRAVASMKQLIIWTQNRFSETQNNALPNGIIALKGGDLTEELEEVKRMTYIESHPISQIFDHAYFEDKYIVHAQGGT